MSPRPSEPLLEIVDLGKVFSIRQGLSVTRFSAVEDASQGVSVLYITHDLATAYYTADRIAVMHRGWIVETGPVETVLGEPLHPYTRLLKAAVPQADPDKAWTADQNVPQPVIKFPLTGGCKFAARCPAAMDRCRAEVPAAYEVDGRKVKCFLYE